jgi:hypothetical protein
LNDQGVSQTLSFSQSHLTCNSEAGSCKSKDVDALNPNDVEMFPDDGEMLKEATGGIFVITCTSMVVVSVRLDVSIISRTAM